MKYFSYTNNMRYFMPRLKNKSESGSVAVLDEINVDRDVSIPRSKKQIAQERIRPIIDEGIKLVKGRFKNYESPGGTAQICVKMFPEVPEFNKVMIDGNVYEIPLYVAKFLNGVDMLAGGTGGKTHTCSYAVNGFKWEDGQAAPTNQLDGQGIPVPIITVAKWNRRYGFESLEFDSAKAS